MSAYVYFLCGWNPFSSLRRAERKDQTKSSLRYRVEFTVSESNGKLWNISDFPDPTSNSTETFFDK